MKSPELRANLTASDAEVEKIAMVVAKLGVEFEPMNPANQLMIDRRTGRFRDDVKTERVMSCVLEFKVDQAKLLAVVNALTEVAKKIDTVFSVGCICRCLPDGTVPIKAVLDQAGIFYRPNGKTNIGLGRPLVTD